jgi:predicted O-methyltransferase YrrM
MYKFTNNWFQRNINISMKILSNIFENKVDKIDILEIGSHEGQSTVWLLDNLCKHEDSTFISIDPFCVDDITSPVTNETYNLFLSNTSKSPQYKKFKHIKDFSNIALPKLLSESYNFDIIYIDGSHLEKDVYNDLEYSNKLIRKNGIILLDDVGFTDISKSNNGVPKALNTFINKYSNDYNIKLKEYQWMIQKI